MIKITNPAKIAIKKFVLKEQQVHTKEMEVFPPLIQYNPEMAPQVNVSIMYPVAMAGDWGEQTNRAYIKIPLGFKQVPELWMEACSESFFRGATLDVDELDLLIVTHNVVEM